MKTLNTQLASWTELRHDTVLYAKQPYTASVLCSYPDGSSSQGEILGADAGHALRTKDLVATLPNTGLPFVFEPTFRGDSVHVSISAIYTNRLQFLDNFAARMTTLRDISVKD